MSQSVLNSELENGYSVSNLPIFKDEIKHNGKNNRINKKLKSGLYLARHALTGSNIYNSNEISFQEKDGLYIGRQDSRHGVMFGVLNTSNNSGDFQIPVAIKPSVKQEQLLGELAILQYLQEDTSLATYSPLGYFSSDSSEYLITKFDNGVTTFDVYDWDRLNNNHKIDMLGTISKGIGALHSQFLYHGDAHDKNLSIDDKNRFFIVDPEFMVSAKDIAANLVRQKDFGRGSAEYIGVRRNMNRDLTDFYNSTLWKVVNPLKYKNQQDKLSYLQKYIFVPYKQSMLQNSNHKYTLFLEWLADDLLLDWQTKANNEIL